MQVLFRRIEQVAPIDVPVLIQGETGTGKELIARAIQELSARRDRRYQVVNCGAIPRELLYSELFGHERGAFTGAVGRKAGLLAVAASGTLFLDEVGELPLEAQTMLLRFLQHGEVRRLGSVETIRVDVQLISATHRTSRSQSTEAPSVMIFGTVFAAGCSGCLRFAIGARTFRSWSNISEERSTDVGEPRLTGSRRRRWLASKAIPGRGTSASWKACSSRR
jgi:hypothetical protein